MMEKHWTRVKHERVFPFFDVATQPFLMFDRIIVMIDDRQGTLARVSGIGLGGDHLPQRGQDYG
jgi:hypothetical protein